MTVASPEFRWSGVTVASPEFRWSGVTVASPESRWSGVMDGRSAVTAVAADPLAVPEDQLSRAATNAATARSTSSGE